MTEITAEWIDFALPKRVADSHKFTNGYLTAIVGSRLFPGAARLSCHAAARVGAGGVQVMLPESLWPIIGSFSSEIMPVLMKEYDQDIVSLPAFETFLEASERSKALLIGSGLGRSPQIQDLIKSVLSHTNLPAVIDGDALYALGKWGQEFIKKQSQGRWILTPHRGELKRLRQDLGYIDDGDDSGINTGELSQMAKDLRIVIVAKGFPSLIFTPQGEIHINNTGNPAATTAGCGDVLAGIIGGYLAQGLSPEKAARLGLYRAGQAADSFIERTGARSLMASDIIGEL